ncbi:MAG: P1 family peptidase [Saprospiraceae bacterium]|nr:P1 family peptidase [Saprospiraceae bacterium]
MTKFQFFRARVDLSLVVFTFLIFTLLYDSELYAQDRLRDHGIELGVLNTGHFNAITDVKGLKVGHTTLIKGNDIRTGVTAIIPHDGNMYQEKVPAAIYVGNGYGKLAGISQVKELGNIEAPIILTNTLNVATGMNAIITHTLDKEGNENVRSVNAVVGETNDGYLNDIRGRHVTEDDVLEALKNAKNGPVQEGNVGAGTGTICFGWKGGIGTSSRVLPKSLGGYTVGVLVQSNFGGVLQIGGIPVGEKLNQYYLKDEMDAQADGSCMIVVITDAPIDARNIERMAKRAMMGLARTGGIASNGSGDYVIALSTSEKVRITNNEPQSRKIELLKNNAMSPLFMATIEATEEAILNSLFAAKTMEGRDGHVIKELPINDVKNIIHKN